MGELKCLVELNKKDGILIKLKNPDDSIEQTIILDGKKITATCKGGQESTIIEMSCDKVLTTCKGNGGSSTIEQLCDTITITSKNFVVKSENTLMESTDTSIKATNLKTDATDTSIKSSSLKTDASTTTIKSADLKTDSPNTSISGDSVSISGSVVVDVSGGIIKLQ